MGPRFEPPSSPPESPTSVIQVWDTDHDLPRASRILDLPEADWEDARERVRFLSRLRHPALPQLVAIGDTDGQLVLVEDWIEGRPLTQRLGEDGPMPLALALGILSPIVDALSVVHGLGIAHGSLDCDSVMTDFGEKPWLLGLGARGGDPAMDLVDVGYLLKEMVAEPHPPLLISLIADATMGAIPNATALYDRMQLVGSGSEDLLESEDADVSFDFGPDVAFPFDEDDPVHTAGSRDRRILVGFGLGMLVIAGMGWMGIRSAPADPDPDALAIDGVEGAEGAEAGRGQATASPETPTGAWRVDPLADRPTLVLDAVNEVVDRLNRRGRPQFRVQCGPDEGTVTLLPGVPSVHAIAAEGTYALYADVSVTPEGAPAMTVRANLSQADRDLHLPWDPMLAAMGAAESVFVSYAPFASDDVMAVFDTRGFEAAVGQLGACTL